MQEAKFKLSFVTAIEQFNQAFFKQFETVSGKPWITIDGKFLLFDYVHLLKNIRNLWLTEKTQQLEFSEGGSRFVASWHYLKYLFKSESGNLVKQSMFAKFQSFRKSSKGRGFNGSSEVRRCTSNRCYRHSQISAGVLWLTEYR